MTKNWSGFKTLQCVLESASSLIFGICIYETLGIDSITQIYKNVLCYRIVVLSKGEKVNKYTCIIISANKKIGVHEPKNISYDIFLGYISMQDIYLDIFKSP